MASLCRSIADDTSLSCSSSDVNETEIPFNSDLTELYNLSKKLLVDFNPQKTECALFITNRNMVIPNIDLIQLELIL